MHVAAVVLHALGGQDFSTGIALDAAHRVRQTAAVARFAALLMTFLLLRCRLLRPGKRRQHRQQRQDGDGQQRERWQRTTWHGATSNSGYGFEAFILGGAGESALKFPEQDTAPFMLTTTLPGCGSKHLTDTAAQRSAGGLDGIQLDHRHLEPGIGQLLAMFR